jgi:hypothetical protein
LKCFSRTFECVKLHRLFRKCETTGNNNGSGLYSQNVFYMSIIVIDTQIQTKYPFSSHIIDNALPQICSTPNFLRLLQRFQVTPDIKIQRIEIRASCRPLHRPSTYHPMMKESLGFI